METYLDNVLDRLEFESDIDIKFLYTIDELISNMEYINWCERNGLSAYKCLTFLYDYIQGDYDISNDIK
jgi:hypothetical protein